MKINKTYRALLDKSIDSMLSAIEIYNKPNFNYREETFSVLAINAWELLLKAYILRLNRYNIKSLYVMEPVVKKDGTKHKSKKLPKCNRCGKPMSISIFDAINKLVELNAIPQNLKSNLEALIELRDNSIHFVNLNSISHQVQELGFACINNYITIVSRWGMDINLSKYNLYLMPLAYVGEKTTVQSVITADNKDFIDFVQRLLSEQDKEDLDFDIAISIGINTKKENSFDSIGVKYDEDGISVTLSEEDILKRFPWDHAKLVEKCKERYSDFKLDSHFNELKKQIKSDSKLARNRSLYLKNEKSPSTFYYSTNTLKFLDNYYHKK